MPVKDTGRPGRVHLSYLGGWGRRVKTSSACATQQVQGWIDSLSRLCTEIKIKDPGVVTYVFDSSIQEAEASRSVWVWGQPDLHGEFQESQQYTERPCLNKTKQNKNKQNSKQQTKQILKRFLEIHKGLSTRKRCVCIYVCVWVCLCMGVCMSVYVWLCVCWFCFFFLFCRFSFSPS